MKQFLFIILVISICLLPQFFNSCANTSRGPSGGPKDTISPVLLSISPNYKSTNFKGREIVFTFDEFVQLKDQNKFFTMSPVPEKRPTLKIKGKSVVVSVPNNLDTNTTYFVDFGGSVVDLNESNPAEFLTTTFSTGETIDTMVYAGRLIDAYSFEPIDGALVFLYKDDIDSIPFQKNPDAMGRTDKVGVFLIKGLKDIPYKLVAVGDKNNNFRYDAGSEVFAFANKLIETESISDNDSINFEDLPVYRTFTENVRKQFLNEYKQPQKRLIELFFNQHHPEIDSFAIQNISPNHIIRENSQFGDTVKYWLTTPTLPDSIKADIIYGKTDSLHQLERTEQKLVFELEKQSEPKQQGALGRNKDKQKKENKDVLKVELNSSAVTLLEKNIGLNFATPLASIDSSLITLYLYNNKDGKDSIPFNITQDSFFIRRYTLLAGWDIGSKYELKIMPGAFTDIYGLANDTIIQQLETASPDKFSSISVNISNTKGWYMVQLMNGKNVVAEKIAKDNGKLTFGYLGSGKYRIRVVHDWNKNEVWDSGLYLKKRQPEPVEFVKFADNSEELQLKLNWDVEQELDMDKIFTNE